MGPSTIQPNNNLYTNDSVAHEQPACMAGRKNFKITLKGGMSVSVLELRYRINDQYKRVRFPVAAQFSCPLRLGPLGTYPTS